LLFRHRAGGNGGKVRSPRSGRGSLEITYYEAAPSRSILELPVTRRVIAGGLVVLIHGTLLFPTIYATAAADQRERRPAGAEGSKRILDEIEFQSRAITSVEAELSPTTPEDRQPRLEPIVLQRDLLPLPMPVSALKGEADEPSALILGQYLGQIDARIDRAWRRPRGPIGSERFICQVRIGQDGQGNVTDVTLEACNGTLAWQLSLVHAIESASPLPAPADPSVFAHALHVRFEAAPFGPESPPEEYEPAFVSYARNR
jgi:hypothetical protein